MQNFKKSNPRWKYLTRPEELLELKRIRGYKLFNTVYDMLDEGKSHDQIMIAIWKTNSNPSKISGYIQRTTKLLFPELYRERYFLKATILGSKQEPYYGEAPEVPIYKVSELSREELDILKKIINNESEINVGEVHSNGQESIKTVGSKRKS